MFIQIHTYFVMFLLHIVQPVHKKRIFWEDPKKDVVKGTCLRFGGIPFVINGMVRLDCQHGKRRHVPIPASSTKVDTLRHIFYLHQHHSIFIPVRNMSHLNPGPVHPRATTMSPCCKKGHKRHSARIISWPTGSSRQPCRCL